MASNLLLTREIDAGLETLLRIQDIVGGRSDPAADAEKTAVEAFKGLRALMYDACIYSARVNTTNTPRGLVFFSSQATNSWG